MLILSHHVWNYAAIKLGLEESTTIPGSLSEPIAFNMPPAKNWITGIP
jgi:hypothetical protein